MHGCVASAFSPPPYTLIITLIKPQNFDWDDFRKEKLSFGDSSTELASNEEAVLPGPEPVDRNDPRWKPYKRRWTMIAAIASAATLLGHWVLWPLPMYAAKFTFSKNVSLLHCIS
jgi:urea-proton symporter